MKPRQSYDLTNRLKRKILDRIEVILSILTKHSSTEETKLQIKLASLRYELARSKEKVRLTRMKELPGFHGSGDYEIDIYFRDIQKRISNISKKLKLIRTRRKLHRQQRSRKTISIIGYTCSGKTTLFNNLTGLLQRVGEEPFTTLSTKFSKIKLETETVFLVDTIGLIRNLPPTLINAFYSTLEEITVSDVVIIILDSSDSIKIAREKFKTIYNLLVEIQFVDKEIITVLNKTDLVDDNTLNELEIEIMKYTPNILKVSALKGENTQKLIFEMDRLSGNSIQVQYFIPYNSGGKIYNLLKDIRENSKDLKIDTENKGLSIETVISYNEHKKIEKQIKKLHGEVNMLDLEYSS